jgi:cell division protein FtsW (lipid II flippase)
MWYIVLDSPPLRARARAHAHAHTLSLSLCLLQFMGCTYIYLSMEYRKTGENKTSFAWKQKYYITITNTFIFSISHWPYIYMHSKKTQYKYS